MSKRPNCEENDQPLCSRSTLAVFELTPDQFNESLDELIMFLAQVTFQHFCKGHWQGRYQDVCVTGVEVLPGGVVHLPHILGLPLGAPLHCASPQHATLPVSCSHSSQVNNILESGP